MQFLKKIIRLYGIYSSCNRANTNTNLLFLLGLSNFANKYKKFFKFSHKTAQIKKNQKISNQFTKS